MLRIYRYRQEGNRRCRLILQCKKSSHLETEANRETNKLLKYNSEMLKKQQTLTAEDTQEAYTPANAQVTTRVEFNRIRQE